MLQLSDARLCTPSAFATAPTAACCRTGSSARCSRRYPRKPALAKRPARRPRRR